MSPVELEKGEGDSMTTNAQNTPYPSQKVRDDYWAKVNGLEDDHWDKCEALDADYLANRKFLDADFRVRRKGQAKE